MAFGKLKDILEREEKEKLVRERAQRKKEKAERDHWKCVEQQLDATWERLELTQILAELRDVIWPEMGMERDEGLHQHAWSEKPVGFLRAWIFEEKTKRSGRGGVERNVWYSVLCSFRLYRDRLELFLDGSFYEALYLDEIEGDLDLIRRWVENAVIRWKRGKPGRFYRGRIPLGWFRKPPCRYSERKPGYTYYR